MSESSPIMPILLVICQAIMNEVVRRVVTSNSLLTDYGNFFIDLSLLEILTINMKTMNIF